LRCLGGCFPDYDVTPIRRGKCLKFLPGFQVRLQCVGNISRQLRDLRMWRIAVSCRGRSEAWRFEPARRFELVPAFAVDVRPFARRLARRDLDSVAVVVHASDQPADPPTAERFAYEVFIRHRLDAGVLLVTEEPDAGARRVVFVEPPPPVYPP